MTTYSPVATNAQQSIPSISPMSDDIELKELNESNDDKEDNESSDGELVEIDGGWNNPHQNLGDGGFRAAILGFSDGMVSNLLLILGIQFALGESADNAGAAILETGIAGLVASSFSMGIGEWISMKNQSEALKGEVKTQESHLDLYWKQELSFFMQILGEHGISLQTQKMVQNDLKQAPKDKVIEFQLQMELGIDPNDTGNPLKAAGFSAMFVAIGSFIPILPYTFLPAHNAWIVALCLAAFCGFILGLTTGKISGINMIKTSLRQVLGIAIVVGIALLVNYYLVSMI